MHQSVMANAPIARRGRWAVTTACTHTAASGTQASGGKCTSSGARNTVAPDHMAATAIAAGAGRAKPSDRPSA